MMTDFWTQKITVGKTAKGLYHPGNEDLKIAADVLDYLSSFAGTGDPNGGFSTYWPAVNDSPKGTPLIISFSSQSPPNYQDSICDYWDNLVISFRGF